MDARIKALEEDGRQHRATIVAQRLELDECYNRITENSNDMVAMVDKMTTMMNRLEAFRDREALMALKLETVENALDRYLYEQPFEQREDLFEAFRLEGQESGVSIESLIGTPPNEDELFMEVDEWLEDSN